MQTMSWSKLMKSVIYVFVIFMACLVFVYKFPGAVTPRVTQTGATVPTQKPWLAPKSRDPCTCQPGSVLLKDQFPTDQYDQVSQRRRKEFEKHKNRTTPELSKLLLALPNSPLQFPIQGVTVAPLKSGLIPGLALHAREQSSYKVTLKASKGILSSNNSYADVAVAGNGGSQLSLVSNSLEVLNAVLATVSYTSTVYHVHTADLVSFSFENHEAMFPVVIQQPQLPVLFNTGTDIDSQVTIATKTFLRYDSLKLLLSSIRTFYPSMTVIIADDSFEPEKIQGDNIQHYLMPPAQGWFAGRNLAVSQVTTKYFMWTDDDFLFTKDTKIEKMLEVLEAFPELDVVGGSVQGNQFYFSLEYDEGVDGEGGCLYRKSKGKFHTLPGYPQCFLTSGVVNFFLARTDSIQKSRFDPLLKRVAHSEWFMDGLGSMMVASCSDVSIEHQIKKNSDLYNKYRMPTDKSDTTFKYQLHFFKNHLKCIKFE